MSFVPITLTVYDLFAYTIPGVAYLSLVGYILTSYKVPIGDILNVNLSGSQFLLGFAICYVVGLVLDYIPLTIAHFVYRQGKFEKDELRQFTQSHPNLKVDFNIKQIAVLKTLIAKKMPEKLLDIEKNKALCIMLRNISFAGVIFVLVQIHLFCLNFSFQYLIYGVIVFVFSFCAVRQAVRFNRWYYSAIFEAVAVVSGYTLDELVGTVKKRQSGSDPETRK